MSNTKLLVGTFLIGLMIAAAGPATAHHSYALYDMTKTLHSKATIKEFYWGAPHSSISVVLDGDGKGGEPKYLTLQGAAPTTLAKAGFRPRDIRRGMKVEITWHPLRSGKLGGTLTSIKFGDGRTFVDNEFGNVTPANPATQR